MRTLVATLTLSVILLAAPAATFAARQAHNDTPSWIKPFSRDRANARFQTLSPAALTPEREFNRETPPYTPPPAWTEQQGKFGFKHQYVLDHDDFQDQTHFRFTPRDAFGNAVPEPGGLTALAGPLAGCLLYWRRRRAS